LGRSDRAALRRRQRALQLLGFRDLERGLHLRPDNLAGGTAEVRIRLYRLGLEPDAAVFSVASLDDEREQRARALWNGKALTQGYVQGRQRLEKWLSRAKELELVAAAREAFLLGNDAIRNFIFDPLLPEPLVDERQRHAFVETLIAFDRRGHAIWRELGAGKGEQVGGAVAH
jgi:phenylacetic acid degradation operon negative regulatory protein